MITYLKGRLMHKTPTRVVIEVAGVGFDVAIPLSSFEALGDTGTEVLLLTHLHVRQDGMELFGFATPEERQMFLHLLSVPGIGPRLAHNILSGASVKELRGRIIRSDVGALSAIRGVGKKIAQRLVMDLRERLAAEETIPGAAPVAAGKVPSQVIEDALLALVSLGHPRDAAQRTLEAVLTQVKPHESLTVEELVKRALRNV
ncbi:MAG: Holliday junction branch migration protein RuvA [candidate division KSB1 bacterium]|nr:Holliday junction branch migration protein RuvA [candidate division KSB1 bacterium]MDZ7296164.1 Holliday junction branch migration protein RuvA [candidate division KSB1 bacterium]